jgi:putative transposase
MVIMALLRCRPSACEVGGRAVHPIRWRKQYGGMSRDQLRQLKELQKENERLRMAVADLTLDKLILREASSGNF